MTAKYNLKCFVAATASIDVCNNWSGGDVPQNSKILENHKNIVQKWYFSIKPWDECDKNNKLFRFINLRRSLQSVAVAMLSIN